MNNHTRVITMAFKGPTNTSCSKVILRDKWHEQSVSISLSGANMLDEIESYLLKRGFTIASYGWTDQTISKGVVMVNDFDIRIK